MTDKDMNETLEKVEGEIVNEVVSTNVAMEFRLLNPTEDGFLRKIQWNRDELEAAVRQKIADYENVVYTEETMKQGKADRAELNKLITAIEDRRKQVKNKLMEPYTTFESEIKEVLELIRKPVNLIDKQVSEFEEQQKQEKKTLIQGTYDESIGDLTEILPFEKLFDSRYLNKTYKLSQAQTEVKEKIEKVRTDLATIDGMDSEFKLNVRDVYIRTYDLSKAMAEDRRLRELKEKMEAERREKEAAEAARIAKAEAEREDREIKCQNEEKEAVKGVPDNINNSVPDNRDDMSDNENNQIVPENAENDTSNQRKVPEEAEIESAKQSIVPDVSIAAVKKYKATFWCIGTKEQLESVLEFMRQNDVKYGRVHE